MRACNTMLRLCLLLSACGAIAQHAGASPEEQTAYRAHLWSQMDANDDGKYTADERPAFYKRWDAAKGTVTPKERQLNDFKYYDDDGDGVVTEEEYDSVFEKAQFQAAAHAKVQQPTMEKPIGKPPAGGGMPRNVPNIGPDGTIDPRKYAYEAFKDMDTNRDGKLSKDEVVKQNKKSRREQKKMRKQMEAAGEIVPPDMQIPDGAVTFAEMDADGDGWVSPKENEVHAETAITNMAEMAQNMAERRSGARAKYEL